MNTGAPRTILQATRDEVRKMKRQEDMENLQDLTCACKDFEVSIGDDHGWAKWVPVRDGNGPIWSNPVQSFNGLQKKTGPRLRPMVS